MRKYKYLGVTHDRCCILSSLAEFEQIKENQNAVESDDFVYESSTDWNGSDKVERTCNLKCFHPTGRKVILSHPITFSGTDYDMGHEYDWTFEVNEIWEL